MTNIAVISDIHGFTPALRDVLADIERHGPFDHLVVAGDLVEGGPEPKRALDMIRSLNATVIQGNTDRDIANGSRDSGTARWITDQLTNSDLDYLRSLPFSHRIHSPGEGGDSDTDVLVVHANPVDLDRHIPPDASPHELHELLGEIRAAVIAFGHLHIAYRRDLGDRQLIDVSAVGNPKDGDLRSKWGSIAWDDDQGWQTELHYVDYPLEETVELMRTCGMPNSKKHINKLTRASYE